MPASSSSNAVTSDDIAQDDTLLSTATSPLSIVSKLALLLSSYSEKQVKDELFATVDEDNSGELSRAELRKALVGLGLRVNGRELDELMLYLDVDKSGFVSLEELLLFRAAAVSSDTTSTSGSQRASAIQAAEDVITRVRSALMAFGDDALRKMFSIPGGTRRKDLDAEELLLALVETIGVRNLTANDVDLLLRAMDENNDGFVSYEELSKFLDQERFAAGIRTLMTGAARYLRARGSSLARILRRIAAESGGRDSNRHEEEEEEEEEREGKNTMISANALRSLLADRLKFPLSEAQLAAVIAMADLDGSGSCDVDEVLYLAGEDADDGEEKGSSNKRHGNYANDDEYDEEREKDDEALNDFVDSRDPNGAKIALDKAAASAAALAKYISEKAGGNLLIVSSVDDDDEEEGDYEEENTRQREDQIAASKRNEDDTHSTSGQEEKKKGDTRSSSVKDKRIVESRIAALQVANDLFYGSSITTTTNRNTSTSAAASAIRGPHTRGLSLFEGIPIVASSASSWSRAVHSVFSTLANVTVAGNTNNATVSNGVNLSSSFSASSSSSSSPGIATLEHLRLGQAVAALGFHSMPQATLAAMQRHLDPTAPAPAMPLKEDLFLRLVDQIQLFFASSGRLGVSPLAEARIRAGLRMLSPHHMTGGGGGSSIATSPATPTLTRAALASALLLIPGSYVTSAEAIAVASHVPGRYRNAALTAVHSTLELELKKEYNQTSGSMSARRREDSDDYQHDGDGGNDDDDDNGGNYSYYGSAHYSVNQMKANNDNNNNNNRSVVQSLLKNTNAGQDDDEKKNAISSSRQRTLATLYPSDITLFSEVLPPRDADISIEVFMEWLQALAREGAAMQLLTFDTNCTSTKSDSSSSSRGNALVAIATTTNGGKTNEDDDAFDDHGEHRHTMTMSHISNTTTSSAADASSSWSATTTASSSITRRFEGEIFPFPVGTGFASLDPIARRGIRKLCSGCINMPVSFPSVVTTSSSTASVSFLSVAVSSSTKSTTASPPPSSFLTFATRMPASYRPSLLAAACSVHEKLSIGAHLLDGGMESGLPLPPLLLATGTITNNMNNTNNNSGSNGATNKSTTMGLNLRLASILPGTSDAEIASISNRSGGGCLPVNTQAVFDSSSTLRPIGASTGQAADAVWSAEGETVRSSARSGGLGNNSSSTIGNVLTAVIQLESALNIPIPVPDEVRYSIVGRNVRMILVDSLPSVSISNTITTFTTPATSNLVHLDDHTLPPRLRMLSNAFSCPAGWNSGSISNNNNYNTNNKDSTSSDTSWSFPAPATAAPLAGAGIIASGAINGKVVLRCDQPRDRMLGSTGNQQSGGSGPANTLVIFELTMILAPKITTAVAASTSTTTSTISNTAATSSSSTADSIRVRDPLLTEEVTCAWGAIPLASLIERHQNGTTTTTKESFVTIPLLGGSPGAPASIDPQDIFAGRRSTMNNNNNSYSGTSFSFAAFAKKALAAAASSSSNGGSNNNSTDIAQIKKMIHTTNSPTLIIKSIPLAKLTRPERIALAKLPLTIVTPWSWVSVLGATRHLIADVALKATYSHAITPSHLGHAPAVAVLQRLFRTPGPLGNNSAVGILARALELEVNRISALRSATAKQQGLKNAAAAMASIITSHENATITANLALRLLPLFGFETVTEPSLPLTGLALDDTVAKSLFVNALLVSTDPSSSIAAFQTPAAWRPLHVSEQLIGMGGGI